MPSRHLLTVYLTDGNFRKVEDKFRLDLSEEEAIKNFDNILNETSTWAAVLDRRVCDYHSGFLSVCLVLNFGISDCILQHKRSGHKESGS